MKAIEIRSRLGKLANPQKAKILQGFFKTGPGQYGEGDVFLGITVPVLRTFTKTCCSTTLSETVKLLRSSVHEERLLALFLLARAFQEGDGDTRNKVYEIYFENTRFVNNWDLVDQSAPNIVGKHLLDKSRAPLCRLARSEQLWERRIAIVATFSFIRQNQFADTFKIAGILLNDEHDLIQKAVGWMLREVGKRNRSAEEAFLLRHYKTMPRTMLRYAIERFPETVRHQYLKGFIGRNAGGKRH